MDNTRRRRRTAVRPPYGGSTCPRCGQRVVVAELMSGASLAVDPSPSEWGSLLLYPRPVGPPVARSHRHPGADHRAPRYTAHRATCAGVGPLDAVPDPGEVLF